MTFNIREEKNSLPNDEVVSYMRLVTNCDSVCKKFGEGSSAKHLERGSGTSDSVTRDLGQAYRTPVN
jgi:hypothetical protein